MKLKTKIQQNEFIEMHPMELHCATRQIPKTTLPTQQRTYQGKKVEGFKVAK